jgi:NAD-dependent histone deacetylase SIR2
MVVPDFRSATGLFTTLRSQHKLKASGAHLFDASVYKDDSSTSSFHDMVRELSHLTRNAKPTLFHHLLASLAKEGRLLRLYTQNVDGIDTSIEPLKTAVPLPSKQTPDQPWPKTVQLHGGLEKMVCTKCGKLETFDGALFEGPTPPSCKVCEEHDDLRSSAGMRSHGVGRLRPRMVLYNEFNPDEEAIGAVSAADLRSRPDAVIVVGTSLKIPGVRRIVREMCAVARGRRDGFTAWINNGPEPSGAEFKDSWDLVVRGDCDDVAFYANMPRWDDNIEGTFQEMKLDEVEKSIRERRVEVLIPASDKSAVCKTQGILTPTASPRHATPILLDNSKLKQPKFALGKAANTKTATNTKPAAKKAGRKAPPKQTNKISSSFAVTKSTTKVKSEPVGKPSMFPNLGKTLTPMRPISPSAIQNNMDPASQQLVQELGGPPKSPEQVCKEEMSKTVSPRNCGIPKDMGHLLD